jgi:hypothetical protein
VRYCMLMMPLAIGLATPDTGVGQTLDTMQDGLRACEAALSFVDGEAVSEADMLGVIECSASARALSFLMEGNCDSAQVGDASPHPSLTAGHAPSTHAVIQAFVNLARDTPSLWGESFLGGMMLAIHNEFPCEG